MKRYILTIILLVTSVCCFAQNNRVVNGMVMSVDGQRLGNAIIKPIGIQQLYTSNDDGTFQISVPSNVRIIEVSAKGYLTKQLEVDGSYLLYKLKVDKRYSGSVVNEYRPAAPTPSEPVKQDEKKEIHEELDEEAKARIEHAQKVLMQHLGTN